MPLTSFKDESKQLSKAVVKHADRVLKAMRNRTSDNPVKSREIEAVLGVGGPTVRAIISHLRRQGHPIASHHRGYHYDASWKDITDTISHLQQRRNARETVIRELTVGLLKAQNNLKLDIEDMNWATRDGAPPEFHEKLKEKKYQLNELKGLAIKAREKPDLAMAALEEVVLYQT